MMRVALLTLCLMVIIGFLSAVYCMWRITRDLSWIPNIPLTMVYSGYEGMYLSKDGGKEIILFELKSKLGEMIRYPHFVITENCIAYWSSTDGALCVFTGNKPRRWISVPEKLRQGCEVVSVYYYQNGLILNLWRQDGPAGVLEVNLTNNQTRPIVDVFEAKSTNVSNILATKSWRGDIKVYNGGLPIINIFPSIRNGDWGYEPVTGTLYMVDSNKDIILSDISTKYHWTIQMPWELSVFSVALAKQAKQLLVSVNRPFSAGSAILVYDHLNGKLLGKCLENEMPMGRPIIDVNDKEIELLKQYH